MRSRSGLHDHMSNHKMSQPHINGFVDKLRFWCLGSCTAPATCHLDPFHCTKYTVQHFVCGLYITHNFVCGPYASSLDCAVYALRCCLPASHHAAEQTYANAATCHADCHYTTCGAGQPVDNEHHNVVHHNMGMLFD
jgi:hypothetical protein